MIEKTVWIENGLRLLRREPWRGGQICGEQLSTASWTSRSSFCGEFKKPGSPLCAQHDEELRQEHDGRLPRFAPGNALGLELKKTGFGWSVFDHYGDLCSSASDRAALEEFYGFTLRWEPYEGDEPEMPSEDDLRAFADAVRGEYEGGGSV